ncbi:hypothetical protein [Sphingomonas humi]
MRNLATAVVLLSLPAGVQAREPVLLKPLSPWNLQYQPESCKLVRSFGDPARPTVMVLERISPESPLSLLVYGGGLRSQIGDEGVTAAFLPFASNPFRDGAVAQTATTKDPAIYWLNVLIRPAAMRYDEMKKRADYYVRDLAWEAGERAMADRTAAAITGLQIDERGRRTVLMTGSLGKAYPLMRQCAADQMAAWGIDPAVQEKLVRAAKPLAPLSQLFRSSDYPKGALKTGDESVIRARLLIDATGKVTKCTSLTAFSAPGFADVVCARLRLAKFSPAELADGTRIPDFTTTNIKFVMGQ